MKLLLTWLLGVPALVAAMVLARAMSPQGMQGPVLAQHQRVSQVQASCGQVQLDQVFAAVLQDGHSACNRASIQ